jgi:hypothetical protein
VASLRAALDPNSGIPFDRDIAYKLYRQVLGPIEDVISDKNRISFVLNGALTSLPLQVLITSDPKAETLPQLIGLSADTQLLYSPQ